MGQFPFVNVRTSPARSTSKSAAVLFNQTAEKPAILFFAAFFPRFGFWEIFARGHKSVRSHSSLFVCEIRESVMEVVLGD